MTLGEARACIGSRVIYCPRGGKTEPGVIAAVSSVYVFVQYAGKRGTMATYPEDLVLVKEVSRG